jgi:putative ABC transport system permease protein
MLSVGVSFCLLGLLMAIYAAFYFADPAPEQALRLVTINRVSLTYPMPIYYREQIRQVPGVREVMAQQWYGGTYKDSREGANFFARFAVQPEKIFTVYGEIRMPDDQKEVFRRDRASCIMGRPLAEKLGLRIGDRVPLKGDIFPVDLDLKIVGIFDSSVNQEAMYFHLDALFESGIMPASRKNLVGQFVILAESPEAASRLPMVIDRLFENAPQQTKTASEQNFALMFVSFLGNLKVFLLSVLGAVTFTILLVSANTMAMTVRERVREVGILKTLGFTNQAVLGIILGESALISLSGGVLGVILASMLCQAARHSPIFFQQIKNLSLPPHLVALSLALALVMGVASSFMPAWGASRTTILDALRHTG